MLTRSASKPNSLPNDGINSPASVSRVNKKAISDAFASLPNLVEWLLANPIKAPPMSIASTPECSVTDVYLASPEPSSYDHPRLARESRAVGS